MIRSFEKTHINTSLSTRAKHNGRVPIFAVSASLVEKERGKYIQTGFDGWILKPVDFKRVDLLLKGVTDPESRNSCLYEPGKWERGGWFDKRKPDAFAVDTHPSQQGPTAQTESREDKEEWQPLSAGSSPHSEATITPLAEKLH